MYRLLFLAILLIGYIITCCSAAISTTTAYNGNDLSEENLIRFHNDKTVRSVEDDDQLKSLLNELYATFLSNLPYDLSYLHALNKPKAYESFIIDNDDDDYHRIGKHGKCDDHIFAKEFRMCPVHWETRQRSYRYPYIRSFAICACQNCLGKTMHDSDKFTNSNCRPIYSLMPALIRRQQHDIIEPSIASSDSLIKKWKFALEKVPISCYCGATLNSM